MTIYRGQEDRYIKLVLFLVAMALGDQMFHNYLAIRGGLTKAVCYDHRTIYPQHDPMVHQNKTLPIHVLVSLCHLKQ